MKNLLKNFAGVLGGLFFAVAASYGISGGPVYNPVKANLNGSFAGVMLPKSDPSPSPEVPSGSDSRNSMGIFSFVVAQPTVGSSPGNASGRFILFSHGRVIPGNVTGVADATSGKLNAVLQGSATPSGSPENVNGTMQARAKTATDTRFQSSGVQLRGHSTMNFNLNMSDAFGDPVVTRIEYFKVRGFQHASPAPTATP